jgi:4-carboxymuconolactone decarboxylase
MTPEHEELLRRLAICDEAALEALLGTSFTGDEPSGLEPRALALVRLAGLVAVGADPAAYLWGVAGALAAGASEGDVAGVLVALAPIVGRVRVRAAAPDVALAIGLDLGAPAAAR